MKRSESELTWILDEVVQRLYRSQPHQQGAPADWNDLPPNQKMNIKQGLLPAVLTVLDVIDAEPHKARRDDDVAAWLKRRRDEGKLPGMSEWDTIDGLLDDYRAHADYGTPLDQEVPGP